MSFEFLFRPLEQLDESLTGLFSGAPLAVALGLAFVLGLRHASDPDHLVAVTSLLARRDAGIRAAARIGAWWGFGHAGTLVLIGVPLIASKSELPDSLERGAETGVGLIVLALAARVLWKWLRGDYRAGPHSHAADPPAAGARVHRHLRRGEPHGHGAGDAGRTPRQAFLIGVVHGLAGTGAIVVLLIAAMPGRLEAAAALALFAPMSILSMSAMTAAFAWFCTRPAVAPVYRGVMIPAIGSFGLLFGLWYAGIAG